MEENIQPAPVGRRPVVITIVCGVFLVGVLASAAIVFSDAARRIGAWYPPYLAVCALVGFISMIGLWMMRRWAVHLYTAVFLINQAVLVITKTWNVLALVLPGVVIAVMLVYVRRMR